MIILSQPEPPKKWSIKETCKECTSQLEVEENDLFRMGPEFAAFSPHYSPTLKAGFECPVCNTCQEIQTEYPQPEVLLEYNDWTSKAHPSVELPNLVYKSPYNEFHVIHLSIDGARLFYPDPTKNPIMQQIKILWPWGQTEQKYFETKALLEVHANQVFEDPQYPLNGLRYLYAAPEPDVVIDTLETQLRQKMITTANRRTNRRSYDW